ncbi:MAG: NADPH:quinone oxidoreductase family protein [Alphaproteobacteria bacterium]|nr:NADPH:quinone oxidoreductase family protein [Alphaproteobacteria bacterium]
MKAVLCKSLEGPKGLIVEELCEPEPAAGEVVVAVRACALNFFDTLITRGKYQFKPDLPFSPGGEISGIVQTVGSDVAGFQPGDRVAAYLGWGGAREKVAVGADKLTKIPDGVSDEAASGVSITYGTALHGLRDRADLQAGETVAVLGASGGAGLAAVEIAAAMGAKVIAVASGESKLAVCRQHGAHELVDYKQSDLKTALRDVTGGRGVDVIYDCVGGDSAEPALRAMAWEGRYLVVGFASGDIPKIPLNLLLLKGSSAVGVFWGEAVKRDLPAHRRNTQQILDWVATGSLKALVGKTFPIGEVVEALSVISERKAVGKIVLLMPQAE